MDTPFDDLSAVLRAYKGHLTSLARRVIEVPRQPGETPAGRIYAAIDASKDAWKTYSDEALRHGTVIEAGDGRASFYNILAKLAASRWRTPRRVAVAITWQRVHHDPDPDVDTVIISWVEASLAREWLRDTTIGRSGTAVGSTAEMPVRALSEHEQPRGHE